MNAFVSKLLCLKIVLFFSVALGASEKSHEEISLFETLETLLSEGITSCVHEGGRAPYLLSGRDGTPYFIIKPKEERHLKAPQIEAFCYRLAVLSGLEHLTPETHLAHIPLPEFSLPYTENRKERLCSVQRYLGGTITLRSLLRKLFAEGLEIEPYIDREDFAAAILFTWLTFDTDAHASNFLVYPKYTEPLVYGIRKIDNGLSFPEKNEGVDNFLMHLPNALKEISESVRETIEGLPLEQIMTEMDLFSLTTSKKAFEQRVSVLRNLISRKGITYYEIGLRLLLLERPDGIELALSPSCPEKSPLPPAL